VKEVRQQGMVAAIELQGYDVRERIGLKLYEYALTQGVLLRPLGHIIYFMPPYIITYDEIDRMMDVAYEGIGKLEK
jgi:adenosylmethionine-8-amino-7-oxononanoate aminotransferase